jgi:hypothetical protein
VHFAWAIAAVATTIAVASVMCTLPKLLLTLFNNLLRLIWPESALGRERFAFDRIVRNEEMFDLLHQVVVQLIEAL